MFDNDNGQISVIIADDEPLICDLLKALIKWDELGLNLICVVHDGKELSEMLFQHMPDIAITDICMPEMNGIELIQHTRERGLSTRFIIVSGYRQFEYAHKALQYDVENYLLKPIDGDELNECLRKTVSAIHRTNLPRSEQGAGYQHVLIDQIMSYSGHPEKLELDHINREFHTSFKPGVFRYATIKLDVSGYAKDITPNALTLTEKIARVVEQSLTGTSYYTLSCCRTDSVTILVNYEIEAEESVMHALNDGFTRGLSFIDLFVGIKMALGISRRFDCLANCVDAKIESQRALWCRIVQPSNSIFQYDDITFNENLPDHVDTSTCEQLLLTALNNIDDMAFAQTYTQILNDMVSVEYAVQTTEMLYNLCRPIATQISNMRGQSRDEEYLFSELRLGLFNAHSIETLENFFFNPIQEILHELRLESEQKKRKPIRQAVAFMEANYYQPLKLDDMASMVYLSAHYFSSLFIAEMGQSFSDYLIQIRLEAAKKMLRDTNLSIKEISAKVGYSDSRYFSRLFTQKLNIKPKEYRKLYG